MDGIGYCEQFSGQNALHYMILHIQSQNFSRGDTPASPQREGATPPVPGTWTRHQFPLGSPAFPMFLFYETTTAAMGGLGRLALAKWAVWSAVQVGRYVIC